MPVEKSSRDATTIKKKKRKTPTAPIGFQLHTERLAQERDDSRWLKEAQESRQFLKSQQKLFGKKKTEEFERLRLIRPQDRVARQRNLHQNGKSASSKAQEQVDAKQQRHLEAQAAWSMLSAREREKEEPSSPAAQRRPRPQSAKPVLQSHAQSGITSRANEIVSGTKISVRRLENCGYNPMAVTPHLSASQSAAQLHMPRYELSSKAGSVAGDADQGIQRAQVATGGDGTTSGKQRIVVYMKRLELSDSDDDELVQEEPGRSLKKTDDARKSAWAE